MNKVFHASLTFVLTSQGNQQSGLYRDQVWKTSSPVNHENTDICVIVYSRNVYYRTEMKKPYEESSLESNLSQ